MFTASFLFASLLWGSVGVGYFIIYGKKQQSLTAMIGGILMVGVSYLVGSALLMSLICILVVGSRGGLLVGEARVLRVHSCWLKGRGQ